MCNCKNIEVGSYDNQTIMRTSLAMEMYLGKDSIAIDSCMSDEIRFLWNIGIRTTGCCCGHNKKDPYIGVIDDDIPVMKGLGYKIHYNPLRPLDEDSFFPKSIVKPSRNAHLVNKTYLSVHKMTK